MVISINRQMMKIPRTCTIPALTLCIVSILLSPLRFFIYFLDMIVQVHNLRIIV